MEIKKVFLFLFVILNVVQRDICFGARRRIGNRLELGSKKQHNKKNNPKKKENFRYVCGHCIEAGEELEKFEEKENLLRHVCKEHLNKAYQEDLVGRMYEKEGGIFYCKECGYENKKNELIKNHVESKYYKIGYLCCDCGSIKGCFSYLKKHFKSGACQRRQDKKNNPKKEERIENLRYVCRDCFHPGRESEEFEGIEDIFRHACEEHLDKTYQEDLVETMYEKEDGIFYCKESGYDSEWGHLIKSHVESEHCKIAYLCCNCKSISKYWNGFKDHIKSGACQRKQADNSKKKNNLQHVCGYCIDAGLVAEKFEEKEDVLRHVHDKHLNKTYLNKTYQKDFFKTMYEKRGRKFYCNECVYKNNKAWPIKKHVESEHCKIRFLCRACGSVIGYLGDFNRHLKSGAC